jgi:hypothetical protein
MLQPCRLCGTPSELQESHVVPAFVYKWLKETSATGFIRFGQNPNKRVQDGYKEYWLCSECEKRLNVWETIFATKIFHPLNEDGGQRTRYGDWLLKFCTSVSWRTLLMLKEFGLEHFTELQRGAADRALATWAKCLLGELPNPGSFEQHLLPLDAIEDTSAENMPPNINRYILRTVDLDVVRSESTAFVVTKMSKYFVLGFIDVNYPKQWRGTKIHAREGLVGSDDFTLPVQFRDYLFDEAKKYGASVAKISEQQHQKMDKLMWENLERVSKSGSFKAMTHDVRIAGKAAFAVHRPKKPT